MTQQITKQRVWLISGASSGIGRALAQAALDRGDDVVALSRTAPTGPGLSGRGTLLPVPTDVRDEGAVRVAVERAVEQFGRLDVVVNAAGYGLFGAVEEASDLQARAIFDTNVFGTLNVLRHTLPVLRAQGSGHVVQGSSVYGQYAHAGVGLLAATKHALEGLSEALAAELGPLGVRVTIVEPGFTATSFLANLDLASPLDAYDGTVRAVQAALGDLPATAFSAAEDVAGTILAAVDADRSPLRVTPGGHGTDDMRSALSRRQESLSA